MAQYTVLEEEEIARLLGRFGLPGLMQFAPEPKGALNTGYHVWSGGHRYFLRVNEHKSTDDVVFEAEVQRYLHEAQFPVPDVLLAQDGRPFVLVGEKPAMLFAYAPGEAHKEGEATAQDCRRLGEQMGRLHELGAGFGPSRPNPYGPSWASQALARLEPVGTLEEEVAAALPLLREEVRVAQELPGAPRGLVHGDLFMDNVLFIGDRVSALLDWEMSCVDALAYDLAVAVNAWCFEGAYVPQLARALLEGYKSLRKVEEETFASLFPWARYAALRWTLARILGYVPKDRGGGRLARKDWRTYRDRLLALLAMGESGYRELVGI